MVREYHADGRTNFDPRCAPAHHHVPTDSHRTAPYGSGPDHPKVLLSPAPRTSYDLADRGTSRLAPRPAQRGRGVGGQRGRAYQRRDRRIERLVGLAVAVLGTMTLVVQSAVDAQPPASLPPHPGPPAHVQTMAAHSASFDVRKLRSSGTVSHENAPERAEPESTVTGQLAQDGAGIPSGGSGPAPAADKSFEGLAFNDDCGGSPCGDGHPPDTNGDVGPTYYIQTVNTSIGIFDKSSGSRVAAFTFNAFMSQGNFGNLCDTDNFGDPVVVYDSFADRWIISDFAFQIDASGNVVSPPGSFQCFAVSQSNDPVAGGWNFYSLNITDALQDYPKLGIWTDGLYMSANLFGFGAHGSFQNSRVWALDKAAMEAGQDATVVSFDAVKSTQGVSVFTLLPANARTSTGYPPNGSPEYFASVWGYTNRVRIWKLHADFATPANSTFTGPTDSTASTTWSSPPATIPELSGNDLDSLGPRLMMQAQYSNIGGVESIWTSHTVAGSSSTQAAVRWYQVPVTGGTVGSPIQAASYNPGGPSRWLPSVAVDRVGDMAMGYSVSDATMHPAIRYAGRLAADAVNTITQSEATLISGTGSQLGNCGGAACERWGDYSAMTLDPVDGCTFWYTTEYYADDSLNDHTRIGAFHFPSCTSSPQPTPTAAPTASPTASPTAAPTASPTAAPTASPTAAPTASPTAAPTHTASPSPTAGDATAPTVSTPTLSPSTVVPAASVTVTGSATDPSGVASAAVRIDAGSWVAMSAVDGSFGGTTEALTASVTAPSTAGSHQVCVRATDASGAANTSDGTACATLIVKDFSLAPTPASQSVVQGAGTTYSIAIGRSSFPDSIAFSVLGLPAGATASFSPNATTASSTILTVTTSNCGTVTPRGTYMLSVSGTGAGDTHGVSLSLTVTNAGASVSSGPLSQLYSVTTLGTTTEPVKTKWGGCDPDGVAAYQLQRQVNGGSWSTVSLASSTSTSINQSLTINALYRYRVRAKDKLGVYGAYHYGPTFKVIASDQTSSGMTWSGSWTTVSTTSAYKGSLRYSTSATASATFAFNGASIGWVAYRGPNRGSAKVYIDGVYQTTISLYATSYSARPIVYTYKWSVNGSHSIKVVVVGTAGHPRVDVDAFGWLYQVP
jgi:hypothetical protein